MTLLRAMVVLLALAALAAAGCGSSKDAEHSQVVVRSPAEYHLVYEKLVGEKGIWIADVDGTNSRPLVPEGHSPAISPDGRAVAYVGGCDADDRCEGTYIVSTSGGKPRRVSSDGGFMWSPDSQRIVVTRGQPPNEELISIGVADGSTWTLAEGSFLGRASFSPDAKQIAYAKATSPTASPDEGGFDLFVAASDGSESKRITHSGDSIDPVWGPKSIAFSRIVSKDTGWGQNEIWRINPDGSGRETITGPLRELMGDTTGWDGLVPIAWSDDGDALLGGMLSYTGPAPFAIDPRSGKARSLGSVYEFTSAVGISHDGRAVLAETVSPTGGADADSWKVLIVPYGGGKGTVVARAAGSPSWNR